MAANKKIENIDDYDSPELEEVKDPVTKTTEIAPQADGTRHLSELDPVLIEKLEKVGGDSASSPRSRAYAHPAGFPQPRQEEKKAFTLLQLFLCLALAAGAYGGFRWLQGEPILPQVVSDAIFGPPPPAVIPPARVQVETDMVGFQLFVNGKPQALYNGQFELPGDQPSAKLQFKRAGYEDFNTQVSLVAGATTLVKPVFSEAKATGFLTYETVASLKLTLFQNGKSVKEFTTPVTGAKVPVGIYKAVLENPFTNYRSEETLLIEEWKTTTIQKRI